MLRSVVVILVMSLVAALPKAAQAADPPTEPNLSLGDDGPEMMRYPPSSVRLKLILGGLGLTAVAYTPALLCSLNWPDVPGAEALRVPVVGPWIALGQSGCAPDNPGCDASLVMRTILTVVDGIAQAGGLAVAAEGIFMTTEAEPEASATAAGPRTEAVSITAAPLVSPTVLGVGLAGWF